MTAVQRNTEIFRQVRDRRLYLLRTRREYLLSLDPTIFHLPVLRTTHAGQHWSTQGFYIVNPNGLTELVRHSVTQPAQGTAYYLFDEEITQQTWFAVLRYTPEDQLAHLLQWGRQ